MTHINFLSIAGRTAKIMPSRAWRTFLSSRRSSHTVDTVDSLFIANPGRLASRFPNRCRNICLQRLGVLPGQTGIGDTLSAGQLQPLPGPLAYLPPGGSPAWYPAMVVWPFWNCSHSSAANSACRVGSGRVESGLCGCGCGCGRGRGYYRQSSRVCILFRVNDAIDPVTC